MAAPTSARNEVGNMHRCSKSPQNHPQVYFPLAPHCTTNHRAPHFPANQSQQSAKGKEKWSPKAFSSRAPQNADRNALFPPGLASEQAHQSQTCQGTMFQFHISRLVLALHLACGRRDVCPTAATLWDRLTRYLSTPCEPQRSP